MSRFAMAVAAVVLLLFTPVAPASAQDEPMQRYAGETRIGAQPPLPIHIELRQSGAAVEGTLAIPMGSFALAAEASGNTITGTFAGPGGDGGITLTLDAGILTGSFSLGEAHGTITAQRTDLDAQAFFQPPEQNLDLTVAQWREDLDRLAEILTREHGAPFHSTTRAAFDAELARIRAAIPELDGPATAMAFRCLAALIGDGHTNVDLPQGRPRLPVEFFWFEDGLRVTGIAATHQNLLGARLAAIDGVDIDDATERLRPFVPAGETEAYIRAALPALLANPDALAAAGIARAPTATFILETADGVRTDIELTTPDAGTLATLNDGPPLWRQNPGDGFWTNALSDGSVYVNWRSYDQLAEPVAALLRDLDATHPRRLIIDLRDNGGGNFEVGRAFIAAIRSRPWLDAPGVLYVLIGRKTYSAAMTNAVDFKTTTNASLVGETAGARPNNWQEVRRFYLPNSGLRVGVSTLFYEFLPGEDELRPDLEARPEPADWGAETDAALRLILQNPG